MYFRDWSMCDENGDGWLVAREMRERKIYNEVFGEFNQKLLRKQSYMPYEEILEKKKELNQKYENRCREAKEELARKAREEYERTHKPKEEPKPLPLWEKLFCLIFFVFIVIAYLAM